MPAWIKLKGDDLFDGYRFHGPDRVLILDENGVVSAIVAADTAGDGIRSFSGILSPGMVNTHCHLELSHMRGMIAEGTGLPAFLTQVMEGRGSTAVSPAEAMAVAEADMWESGIVAVGDISNTAVTVGLKQQGRMYYHTFVESMGFIPSVAEKRLAQSREVYDQFAAINGAMHSSSLVPHAPYSVSAPLFDLIGRLPDNTPVSIHNQESAAENELYRSKTGAFLDFYRHFGMDISGFAARGQNSLPVYLPALANSPLILVHNTYTVAADIHFARERQAATYWCLCPGANLYIEGQLPDVSLLYGEGCVITLGTDSLASNRQLSIWEEIRLLRQYFPAIPFAAVLQWATLNGARALGISDRYGSFEQGKRPGVVLLQENSKMIDIFAL